MENYYLIYLTNINHFVPRRFDTVHVAMAYLKRHYPDRFMLDEYRIDYCKYVKGSLA